MTVSYQIIDGKRVANDDDVQKSNGRTFGRTLLAICIAAIAFLYINSITTTNVSLDTAIEYDKSEKYSLKQYDQRLNLPGKRFKLFHTMIHARH